MLLASVVLSALCAGCTPDSNPQQQQPLLIYAAASLATALPEVGDAFLAGQPEAQIRHHFAASSLLAKQIDAGAQADVYVSADLQWVDYLEERGRLDPASRIEPLGNRLVVITPARDGIELAQLDDLAADRVERIAVADWSHVPAGRYTASVLKRAGLWESLSPKLVPALDVRAALAYVARAEVDFGIVYATDALVSDKVRVIDVIPDSLQPRIRYVASRLVESRHPLAADYLRFLHSPQAAAIFSRYGFLPITESARDD
jgi:molybdate transport system substrate-binding protein